MVVWAVAVIAAAAAVDSTSASDRGDSVQSMLQEESPDVFLAKATLQQYLSRVVRKDWDGVRRLTHSKALAAIESLQKRSGRAQHNLAPWANGDDQLKTFEFHEARAAGPGMVLIAVGEDVYHREEQGMSTGDPAVYILFKARGSWLVGDKKAGAELSDVPADSVRLGYPGWVDHQALAQARRADRLTGKHR